MTAFVPDRAEIGDPLPEVERQFGLDDFRRGDEQTIHTDSEAARREGLAAPVATGPQVASLIFRQLRLSFGRGWIEGGTCELTFRRPVMLTDFCVARGRVVRREPLAAALRVHCEVWIENQRAERVIVGSASALVPPHGEG